MVPVRFVALLAVIAFFGTPGPDVLRGTPKRDVIHAGRGDDRVYALAGDDWLDGGLDDDAVFGGRGSDVIYGGPGDDRLVTGEGHDHVYGQAGDDRIDARNRGGRRLADGCWRPCDPFPRGAEFVSGGPGDDRILTRDGRLHAVSCGSGFDVLVADRGDRVVRMNETVRGCEVVRRR